VDEVEGKLTAKKVETEIPEDKSVEEELVAEDNKISEPKGTSEELQGMDYLEQLQRLQAEFANYKKRVAKEQLYFKELGQSECVSAILPVLDDFDRISENHNNLIGDQAIEGIKLIRDKLIKVLTQQGLKPINSLGEKFDPTVHEAMITAELEGAFDGEIIEEWQKGYLLNNKLLRPAKVKVAKPITNKSND